MWRHTDLRHKMKIFVLLISSILTAQQCEGIYNGQAMERLMEVLKNKDVSGKEIYRREVRPGLPPGPNDGVNSLDVTCTLFLRNFLDIDSIRGRMESQMTFRQEWIDERLAGVCSNSSGDDIPCAQLGGEDVDLVWRPDTFFRNEIESKVHRDLIRNNYLRVFPGGKVLYSVRMTLTSMCPNAASPHQDDELQRTEFKTDLSRNNWKDWKNETFSCTIHVASYGWTIDYIHYKWPQRDPVQVARSTLNFPNHVLNAFTTDTCNVLTRTGEYSCLEVIFAFTDVSDPSKFS